MTNLKENKGLQSKSDELLRSLFRAATMSSRESIKLRSTTEPVPLSASQQQMWFLNQLSPDSPAYNVYRAFFLTGQLRQSVLENCLKEIVRRHDTLRTVFQSKDGVPFQIVQPHMGFDYSFKNLTGTVDLSCRSEDDCWSDSHLSNNPELNELLVSEARKVFDLLNGPCLRVLLLKLGECEYCFMLVMHHIVCDGWSLSIIFRELADLYESFSQGHVTPLPELPIQYSDYVIWQQEWLKGEALQLHFNYWQEQLKGHPRSLDLPADYARQSLQSFNGNSETLTISKGLTKRLKAFSSQEGATLFMTLLAIYHMLLYRYSGQEDVVTGSPLANRNHPETQDLIGCFINTLALRTDLSGSPSFRDLVARVKKMTTDAYLHQDLPFQVLVEKMRSDQEMTFSPLFQAAFVLQNTPDLDWKFSGLTLKPISIDNMTAKYDLNFVLYEYAEELHGKLEYSTDLFKIDTIKRFINHYCILLESILTDPDLPISELPILAENEKHQLLVERNSTKAFFPNNCMHELFEEQVERTPDSIAVLCEDANLSYKELNEQANQLAYYLREFGVGPDILVVICMDRSLEMMVGLLGILKAGGAYLPLDPSYPKERLKFMIDDSNSEILLTTRNLLKYLPDNNIKKICLDNERNVISEYRTENLSNLPNANVRNLAYVIYTSGSTGNPKGVAIDHEAVVNQMYWLQDKFKLNSNNLILQSTPYSFDVSVSELFLPLMSGFRILLAKAEGHKDPAYLIKLIQEHNVTILQFVPSMLQVFLESKGVEKCVSIKWVICAGEVLSYDLKKRFFSVFNTQLINLYGPTETAIYASYWDCRQELLQEVVPIGYPISNYKLYILDKYRQPVPIGVSGELYIGGIGLARGYINRPDLTAERFINNPFFKDSNERLYKTGDMACYLPCGAIKFLGRTDHQVKVRGFRIELGEIESFLVQHPAVKQVVVLAREDEPANKRLVAYIVPEKDSKLSTNGLKDFIKTKLPEYMIPSVFMMLNFFPLMPNGKVDRKALSAPDHERPELEKKFVAPLTHVEKKLSEIWRQVLNLKEVGIEDDFFELGGHSLLAMQLIAWVLRDLQVELSVREVFDFSTIHGLANIIAQKSEKSF